MSLDEFHRRALEDVLGRELRANEQLVISVLNLEPPSAGERAPQSLDAWSHVYEDLSPEEITRIDEVAKSRAKLSRNAP